MIIESVLVGTGIVLIGTLGTLGALGYRRRRRQTYAPVEREPIEDWPTMEARLRQRSVWMMYERKIADARLIVQRACRGAGCSRRYMKALGMSETRWSNAVGLLRDLGIYEPDGNLPMMSERRALRTIDRYEREVVPEQVARAIANNYVTRD